MGGVSTKEEIIARLDELDRKELALNIQLRDLQKQLNDIVPDEEKVKVNENLGREDDIAEINEVGNSNKRNKMKENTKRSQNQKRNKRRDESDDDESEGDDDDDDDDDEEEEKESEEEITKKKNRRRRN